MLSTTKPYEFLYRPSQLIRSWTSNGLFVAPNRKRDNDWKTHGNVVDADVVRALGRRRAAVFHHDAVPARVVRVRERPENTVNRERG